MYPYDKLVGVNHKDISINTFDFQYIKLNVKI